MAICRSEFQQFLSTIEPDDKAVAYAMEAHVPVRDFLVGDGWGEVVVNSFLYGSYKRHTAIGGIKDVDIVLLCDIDTDKVTPLEVLTTLKGKLKKHYKLPNNEEIQSRSVKVNQPVPDSDIELTLDIVPAVIITDEENAILVPDRELDEWKISHPKGHIKHTTYLNSLEVSKGTYVPLVKIVKWWWRHQSEKNFGGTHRPKGFWLECLVSYCFEPTSTSYAEHFVSFLRSVSSSFKKDQDIPPLPDPGLDGVSLSTGMEQKEFNEFLDVVQASLVLAERALSEEDRVEAGLLWREIFGDEFPLVEDEEGKALDIPLDDTSHQQKPIWPFDIRYQTNIVSCVGVPPKSKRSIQINSFPISDGYELTYTAKTNVPKPYEVRWQVVNTGSHAREDRALRGGFDDPKNSEDPLTQTESTKYSGKHWIQCFIIKDGILVSESNKFYITVINRVRKFRGVRRR